MKLAFSSLGEGLIGEDPFSRPAAAQLRAWATSQDGRRLWQEARLPLTLLERVCHVVEMTQASRYGLLITPAFTRLFSTIHPPTLRRLEASYRAAAERGLCFWWNGQTLSACERTQTFFLLLSTLPPTCLK